MGFDLQAVIAHGCVEFWDLHAYNNWDYGITSLGVCVGRYCDVLVIIALTM